MSMVWSAETRSSNARPTKPSRSWEIHGNSTYLHGTRYPRINQHIQICKKLMVSRSKQDLGFSHPCQSTGEYLHVSISIYGGFLKWGCPIYHRSISSKFYILNHSFWGTPSGSHIHIYIYVYLIYIYLHTYTLVHVMCRQIYIYIII